MCARSAWLARDFDFMINLINDPEVSIRSYVVQHLGDIQKYQKKFVPLLQDPSWRIRLDIVYILSDDTKNIIHLSKLLEDPCHKVRSEVERILKGKGALRLLASQWVF
jgi:HEAT repeat protein